MNFNQRYPSNFFLRWSLFLLNESVIFGSLIWLVVGAVLSFQRHPAWKLPVFVPPALALSLTVVTRKTEKRLAWELAQIDSAADAGLSTLIQQAYAPPANAAAVAQLPAERPCLLPPASEPLAPLGAAIQKVLEDYKLKTDWQGAVAAPAFLRVKLLPHPGTKVDGLLGMGTDLKVRLGLDNEPLISSQAGCIAIDIPRSDRQPVVFEQLIQPQTPNSNSPLLLLAGVNIEGKVRFLDLADSNVAHLLVGGTTGGGKTEFLLAALAGLMLMYSSEQVQLVLIDPKRIGFAKFEKHFRNPKQCPYLHRPIVKELDEAVSLLDEMVQEMEQRYKLFEPHFVSDLEAYNALPGVKKLPRIIVMFDEIKDFMDLFNSTRKVKGQANPLEVAMGRLGQKARAAGIHLILCTQHPKVEVLTGAIKANLPARIALKTSGDKASDIILDEYRPTSNLLGKGDMYCLADGHCERLQSLYVKDWEVVREVVARKLGSQKPEVTPEVVREVDCDPFAHSLDGLPVLDSEPNYPGQLPKGTSQLPKTGEDDLRPIYLAIREAREAGKSKTEIVTSHPLFSGVRTEEKFVKYEEAVTKFAEEWATELIGEYPAGKIFTLIYSPNPKNREKKDKLWNDFCDILSRQGLTPENVNQMATSQEI